MDNLLHIIHPKDMESLPLMIKISFVSYPLVIPIPILSQLKLLSSQPYQGTLEWFLP